MVRICLVPSSALCRRSYRCSFLGDTDSVFILLEGRNREEAFRIGNEIAQEITAKSPVDVLLKFEKVYSPCVLVTKKRYVGFAYESLAQEAPHLDAKGIEMVRRDQCPAAVKMQEKALRILFSTRDCSLVRKYLISQWEKVFLHPLLLRVLYMLCIFPVLVH